MLEKGKGFKKSNQPTTTTPGTTKLRFDLQHRWVISCGGAQALVQMVKPPLLELPDSNFSFEENGSSFQDMPASEDGTTLKSC